MTEEKKPLTSSVEIEELTPEKQEKLRKLFAQECKFFFAIQNESHIPPAGVPEIAFAGRSNVGKSSLLNALVNRRSLARTSNTPGRTQQLNFFMLADAIAIVDLPGYGYAKVGRKKVAGWTQLIYDYLQGRAPLRRVFVLIDSRHGIKPNDTEFMNFLDTIGVPFQCVLTKIDKISPQEAATMQKKVELLCKKHPAAFPTTLCTSADEKLGLQELQRQIAEVCNIL